jgi:hypothetical protein
MKTFAGRDTDLRDVRSVIVRQEIRGLDWRHIEEYLAELAELKDDLTLLTRLRDIRESVGRR